MIRSIPVLGTEPASENWIRSCCCSTPGIRFYCKPVTLVRCREIRGEIRFSGLVGGKWLCEMTSAFIIKELRGARALRLFCGRSSLPPPFLAINRLFVPRTGRRFILSTDGAVARGGLGSHAARAHRSKCSASHRVLFRTSPEPE